MRKCEPHYIFRLSTYHHGIKDTIESFKIILQWKYNASHLQVHFDDLVSDCVDLQWRLTIIQNLAYSARRNVRSFYLSAFSLKFHLLKLKLLTSPNTSVYSVYLNGINHFSIYHNLYLSHSGNLLCFMPHWTLINIVNTKGCIVLFVICFFVSIDERTKPVG